MPSIYIDESGTFVPAGPSQSRVSCIAALIVSSKVAPSLFSEFQALSSHFPTDRGEVKGRKLGESQIASVLSLLGRYDALVEATVVDLGAHTPAEVTAFRRLQADYIGRHEKTNPDPRVRSTAARLRANLEAMPDQLFAQAWLTMPLVQRVIQTAALYYGLRAPRELEKFSWRVDAKAAGLTASEDFWRTFILPFAEHESANHPLILVEHGDYRHFRRFMMPPARTARRRGRPGIALHSILSEDLAFVDSASEPGLQLVDVVASTVARAFNGNLQESGWIGLRELLVGLEPQVIQINWLRPRPRRSGRDRQLLPDGPHCELMRKLYSKRPLITR